MVEKQIQTLRHYHQPEKGVFQGELSRIAEHIGESLVLSWPNRRNVVRAISEAHCYHAN